MKPVRAHLPVTAWSDLPGGEMVRAGLSDQAAGRQTIHACLVEICAPKLERNGIPVGKADRGESPESRLFRMLQQEFGDAAHARYGALVRTVDSCARALESVNRREKKRSSESGKRRTPRALAQEAPRNTKQERVSRGGATNAA